MLFVIARNSNGRPTLMHIVSGKGSGVTSCGISLMGWSRSYLHDAIDTMLCWHCKKIGVLK